MRACTGKGILRGRWDRSIPGKPSQRSYRYFTSPHPRSATETGLKIAAASIPGSVEKGRPRGEHLLSLAEFSARGAGELLDQRAIQGRAFIDFFFLLGDKEGDGNEW